MEGGNVGEKEGGREGQKERENFINPRPACTAKVTVVVPCVCVCVCY